MHPLLTILTFTVFLTLTPLTFALPHSLPLTLRTSHSSHKFNFRRSSIHFPSSRSLSTHPIPLPKLRSFLPTSRTQHHNLFPSHDQKLKLKRGGTAETPTAKPYSCEVWNRLSHPEDFVDGVGDGKAGCEGGGGPTTLGQISIFSGGAVGSPGGGRIRRTFGFLRDSMTLSRSSDGNMNPHPSGKHSSKNPDMEKVSKPTAPLRVSMEDFKSFFGKVREGEGQEPGQGGFQKWFGWGKKV